MSTMLVAQVPEDLTEQVNKEVLSELSGTWYIFSNTKPFEQLGILTLIDDGLISDGSNIIIKESDISEDYDIWWSAKDNTGFDVIKRKKGAQNQVIIQHVQCIVSDKDKKKINKSYYEYLSKIGYLESNNKEMGILIVTKDENFANSEITKNLKSKWAKLNKNSVKDHIDFYKSLSDDELKRDVYKSLFELVDKKILKVLVKEYPKYKNHFNKPLQVGEQSYDKLYRFFTVSIAGINPDNDYKIESSITANRNNLSVFDIKWKYAQDVVFEIEPSKNYVRLVNVLKDGDTVEGWPLAIHILFPAFTEYPDIDHIDYKLLDSVK